mgnify:CR=1 FL=1
MAVKRFGVVIGVVQYQLFTVGIQQYICIICVSHIMKVKVKENVKVEKYRLQGKH